MISVDVWTAIQQETDLPPSLSTVVLLNGAALGFTDSSLAAKPAVCSFESFVSSESSDYALKDLDISSTNSNITTIMFTSGSSGKPKGIPFTFQAWGARLGLLQPAPLGSPEVWFI